jgi:hypothetical protein
VPTPALVAPIEFTMARHDYEAIGGHTGAVRSLDDVLAQTRVRRVPDSAAVGSGR